MRKLKTHCAKGHEFSEENTTVNRRGSRVCNTCDRECKKRHREKRKAESEAKGGELVFCPQCRLGRRVSSVTAARLKKDCRLCRSCSRKVVRGRMSFTPATCAKCGAVFTGRSGAARFCDDCVPRPAIHPRQCSVCGSTFVGYKSKTACSQKCVRRLRVNHQYYGGKMFEATGWQEKVCQLCGRHTPKRAHVHHVLSHPNHDYLVVLCAGCHDTVSILARRPGFGTEQFKRLKWFVESQRNKRMPTGIDPPEPILEPRKRIATPIPIAEDLE